MPGLLVSVRSAEEAEAALSGGATIVDVKEPSRGSLGRADDAVIAAVVDQVGGRCRVSAALGELRDNLPPFTRGGLAFVKWGLAGSAAEPRWADLLQRVASAVATGFEPRCRPVAVAYADWESAGSPPPAAVAEVACARGFGGFLLDTWTKDGRNLLHWLQPDAICRLCRRCRDAGVLVALAGSLQPAQIELLRPARPDWFAVRGAACRGSLRNQPICSQRVRELARLAQAC